MAVRSRRLGGPTFLTVTTDVLIYTVPADRTALIKSVSIANNSAGSAAIRVGIGGTGTGAVILRTGTVAATSGLVLVGLDLVAMPGEAVYVAASVANALTVSLHGAQLLGTPA